MNQYFVAIIIQTATLALGVALAYFNQEYRVVDIFQVHDMGLGNFYTWIILMGIIGAGINGFLFRALKIIVLLSILLIIVFLFGYWYLFMRY